MFRIWYYAARMELIEAIKIIIKSLTFSQLANPNKINNVSLYLYELKRPAVTSISST